MQHSLEESPLVQTPMTGEKMTKRVDAQRRGEKTEVNVYGKATEKQLKELEKVRNLSKELQDNLHELENSVRIADVENQAMHATTQILESEDHEFVSANQLDDYYAEEDRMDTKEAEKQRLTKGIAPKTELQNFYKDQCVLVTGGTGFLGKDGRISLKASRVVEKIVL